MTEKEKPTTIHLWSNYAFHEEGYIVCDKAGLLQLRDLLNKMVLDNKEQGHIETMCNDGEGYDLHVIVCKMGGTIAVPYMADYAKEHRESSVVFPWMQVDEVSS